LRQEELNQKSAKELILKMCDFCDRDPSIIPVNLSDSFGVGEHGVIEARVPKGYDFRQYGQNFERGLKQQGFDIVKSQLDKSKLAYRVERRS
jgi:hypothetical protein